MRKVFLSFLGTNDYLPCNYQIAGHDPVANVRFVQEACIARWCVDWGSDDRIFLCVTDESHDRNWVDNGHKDKGGNIPERQGLASRLEGLHLAAPVKPVMVPAGRSEEEIWEIFERVFFLLEEGDQLYLDITHAFRSLPMLAMVILSYAKVMRTVSVRAISYGALEALGSVGDVINLPVEERNVPVFDLLPFDRLQDWVTAVDRFTASGDATLIERLADLDMRPVIKATQGQNTDAVTIKKLGEQLKTFATVLATCRGRNISAAAASVQQSLKRLEDASTLKPLQPLLRKIEPALASFRGEEIADGLAAARWCLDHQLYQQGYTILHETMITFVVNMALGKNGRDQQDRDLVTQCVTIIWKDIPKEDWLPPAKTDKPITRRMIAWLQPQQDLLNGLRNLADVRNDLNHAGHNDKACTPKTIQNKLVGHIEDMERIFARNIASADC